ncbi:class I SAM-dependent methyltransferase [Mucilaginibacter sp. L196]|uniref:class I SAM-dependent methyltransferase n=1 Tax=Mucilaginibacter sp. L196 TaxID=1641870 RepID=UPI00131C080C|nr:class I SAM-dependent methyltransferase [Mucilaginibacter sp. L196]
MAANYNNSAWFYDSLARLVYGKALINAQVYLLKHIPKNAKVLIVGGGTGWILEELTRIHPSGLQITYVEIAPNMMALSRKRNIGSNQVTFVNDDIENIDLPADFDIALTPFLLDNFTDENLIKVFNSITVLLKPHALWLNASFQLTGKWWQRVLLKSMFIFFKVTCGIEASKLPGIDKCFEEKHFKVVEQQNFFEEFIGARIYRK